MKLIGLDTETTGLKADKGDRIVELCAIKIDTDLDPSDSCYATYLVQRLNPRKQIAPEAEAVHGISNDDVAECPYFEDFADQLSEFLADGDWLIAHNLHFDGSFLVAEYERISKPVPDITGFCTMENGRWATATGKLPSLQELCFCCGVDYDIEKAHAAQYDVEVMLHSLLKGLESGWYELAA